MAAGRVEDTITIPASTDAVFDAITTWGGTSASEVDGIEVLEGERYRDAVVRYNLSAFGRTIAYVLRFDVERPSRVGFSLVESKWLRRMDGGYKLEPAGTDETNCTFWVEVEPKVGLPGPLKRAIAGRIVKRSLYDLEREINQA